ncbi:putative CBL-interacting protein kinase 32 [Blattamonas nauphoetae]|uniref:non-specific serine/threonine protein kinase n=1 Tax=Blattamonas nauphoetae TaxID=2049346 RepID=A0ABQ9XL24_9EUKA|nr:putative CBL-interacting protein kinase 32 [Blattamonas nauphoetae]
MSESKSFSLSSTIQQPYERIIHVNKFQVGPTLGEGTFGRVKQARNTITGELVAMKILDKETIIKKKMTEQLQREIGIMKKLSHPNILQLKEVLSSRSKVFIILELAVGGELFQKIVSEKFFREDTARKYFQQLIGGLEYCHMNGICHRDLKPENLLLDSRGTLKISDFGLCALTDDQTFLKTQCGTPHYTAPEIHIGAQYDGKQADIWSCGIILFVMLAGHLPFDCESRTELYQRIKTTSFKFPDNFPPGARDLIEHILVADPTLRYTLQQVKEHPWFSKDYVSVDVFPPLLTVTQNEMDHVFLSLNDREVTSEKVQDSPPHSEVSVGDKHSVSLSPPTLNVFELISASGVLDVSPLVSSNVSVIHVRTNTLFTTTYDITALISRIQAELTAMHCPFKQLSPFVFRVAFQVAAGQDQVQGVGTAKIDIYQMTGNLFLVEMRRGRGGILHYLAFYNSFRKRLEDVAPMVDSDQQKRGEKT